MKKFILILLYISTALIFLFCNNFTTVHPPFSAGNGNIAIIFIIFLIPITVSIIYLLTRLIRLLKLSEMNLNLISTGLFLHITFGIYHQYNKLDDYRDTLNNNYLNTYGEDATEYILMITTGFSNQLNNQYFNINTWLIFFSFTIFISLVFKRFIKRFKRV